MYQFLADKLYNIVRVPATNGTVQKHTSYMTVHSKSTAAHTRHPWEEAMFGWIKEGEQAKNYNPEEREKLMKDNK